MKNYLDFKLSGSRIFPYFLCIFLTYIAYAILNLYAMTNLNPAAPFNVAVIGCMLVYIIVLILCVFHIWRLYITSISCYSEALKFDGDFKEYLKINAIGLLLTIVTFGIYFYWYQKRVCDFYARSTSYNNVKFKFDGKALVLFAICLGFIVVTVVSFFLAAIYAAKGESSALLILLLIFILLSSGPLTYLVYRWYIDFSYGNRKITMRSGEYFSGSCFLMLQFSLVVITFGIYWPAASIRIYRYFVNRVEVRNEEGVMESKMGCDATMGSDFIFIFAQILLTAITFGIYCPWAICKINERLITKTYIETISK